MNESDENINAILSTAANDLQIPTPIAHVLMRIGAELAQQQEEIENLRLAVQQQAERLSGSTGQLGRRIDKLQGVHGA